jgi:hypothetical protein
LINISLHFYTIKIRIWFCQNIAKIIKKKSYFHAYSQVSKKIISYFHTKKISKKKN